MYKSRLSTRNPSSHTHYRMHNNHQFHKNQKVLSLYHNIHSIQDPEESYHICRFHMCIL